MRYLLFVPIFFLLLSSIEAQTWYTNFDEAKKIAKNEGKNILLVFSGSDWCAPCIKLKEEILLKPGFESYAKQALIIMNVDFPRKKSLKEAMGKTTVDQNNALAEKYNKSGYFPHLVILNHEGEVIARTGYKNISPEDYAFLIKELVDANE